MFESTSNIQRILVWIFLCYLLGGFYLGSLSQSLPFQKIIIPHYGNIVCVFPYWFYNKSWPCITLSSALSQRPQVSSRLQQNCLIWNKVLCKGLEKRAISIIKVLSWSVWLSHVLLARQRLGIIWAQSAGCNSVPGSCSVWRSLSLQECYVVT